MKPVEKYKPQIVKVAQWQQIEEYYTDLISHGWELESMLSLIRFIRNNNLDKRLFAYTSLDKLVLTIYNPAEWHRESLHIEFERNLKKWHFEYHPKPNGPIEAERYYSEEDGINKFCQYIEWLKW
jgi:hypothetical protein